MATVQQIRNFTLVTIKLESQNINNKRLFYDKHKNPFGAEKATVFYKRVYVRTWSRWYLTEYTDTLNYFEKWSLKYHHYHQLLRRKKLRIMYNDQPLSTAKVITNNIETGNIGHRRHIVQSSSSRIETLSWERFYSLQNTGISNMLQ